MKKRTKRIIAVGCLVPVLLVTGLICMLIIGPPGPHFTCHRGLDCAFEQWWLTTPNGKTTNALVYPNVDGSSVKSLELIAPYVYHGMDDLRDYGYVPGLTSEDPRELILRPLAEFGGRSGNSTNRLLCSLSAMAADILQARLLHRRLPVLEILSRPVIQQTVFVRPLIDADGRYELS